jgi:hypothetical protein
VKRLTLVLGAIVALLLSTVLPTNALRIQEQANDNVDIVILVDESESLSVRDVMSERDAVRQIVSLPVFFDRNIRISVMPFSSGPESPRLVPGCEFTLMNAAGAQKLAKCANQITRQTSDESSNTDFASAILQATQVFEKDKVSRDKARVVIMLTDGKYDPDGDLKTSIEESESLDSALEIAKKTSVSIWPIGFGKADISALSEYSSSGSQGFEGCPSVPKAVQASTNDLMIQMTDVVANATCLVVDPPTKTPTDYFVHPMLDWLAVSVQTTPESDPILTDPDGTVVCSAQGQQQWEVIGGFLTCLIELDGDSAGNWRLTSKTEDEAIWQSSGTVEANLDCSEGAPVLTMAHVNGTEIDWNAEEVNWPSISVNWSMKTRVKGSAGSKPVGRTSVLTADSGKIQIPLPDKNTSLPDDEDEDNLYTLEIGLAAGDATVPRLKIIGNTRCSIDASVIGSMTTTSSIVTSTTIKCDPSPCPPPPPPPPSPWLYVLAALVVAGGVFGFMKWRRSRLFPKGTVLKQESPVKPGTFIEIDGDIGGKRRVSLTWSPQQKFVGLEPYAKTADYVLTRMGDQVQVQYSSSPGSFDENVPMEVRVEPFGLPIRLPGFVIQVDVPSGLDDDDFE